jgi:REP-associated tyrosine transposase
MFYHVYNQGNNKQTIFTCRNDYLIFLKEIRRCITPHADMVAYCLMPNHFHFMIYTDFRCSVLIKQGGLFIDPVTNGLRKLLSGYARIFNHNNNQTGSLFRQKTKSKCLSEEKDFVNQRATNYASSYLTCFNYIHQNPCKAELVLKPDEWEFSSFKDYAGLRDGSLCNKKSAEILGLTD